MHRSPSINNDAGSYHSRVKGVEIRIIIKERQHIKLVEFRHEVSIFMADSRLHNLQFCNNKCLCSSDDNDVNQNNEDEEEEGRTGTIIGIDLGTTYSECSFVVIVILLWTYSFICIYTTHRKN